MGKFCEVFGDHQLDELTVDDIMDFLNQLTEIIRRLMKSFAVLFMVHLVYLQFEFTEYWAKDYHEDFLLNIIRAID